MAGGQTELQEASVHPLQKEQLPNNEVDNEWCNSQSDSASNRSSMQLQHEGSPNPFVLADLESGASARSANAAPSIFEQQQQAHALHGERTRLHRWELAKHCYWCRARFRPFFRRHHCRACRHSFCWRHSSKRMYLPGYTFAVRVCDACFVAH